MTPAPLPHRSPAVIGITITLLGIAMILPDNPSLNFWGVVLVVVSPILWGLEYMPPAETTVEEASRG